MTESTQEESVVAIYASHDGAEAGIKALQQAGLDMKRLSIVVGVREGAAVGGAAGAGAFSLDARLLKKTSRIRSGRKHAGAL